MCSSDLSLILSDADVDIQVAGNTAVFTLTYRSKPISGLFSAALSLRSPWADVIRHRALWSPEVPKSADPRCQAGVIGGHLFADIKHDFAVV